MLIAPFVLALALPPVPQEAPPPEAPPAQEAPAPTAPAEAPPGVAVSDLPEASPAAAQPHIDAGLAAFKRRRFSRAEIEFRTALDADPQNAAAAFYLGYTYYKIAEPKRANHPDKQKAAELFAKAFAIDPAFRPVWQSAR